MIPIVVLSLAACTVDRDGLYSAPLPPVVRDAGMDAERDGSAVRDAASHADAEVLDTGLSDWLDPAATHRIRLDFRSDPEAAALDDFVVPVRLDPSRIDYARAAANAADLRFRDPDGTLLPHEIERWDPTSDSLIWVRVPRIDSVGDSITLYFGAGEPTRSSDRSVWPDRYLAVYHLGAIEMEAGRIGVHDSTPHANHGRIDASALPPQFVTGPLGRALAFEGRGTGVLELLDREGQIPSVFPPPSAGQRTYEVWFRADMPSAMPSGMPILYMEGCCRGFGITLEGDGELNGYVALAGSGCCEDASYRFVSTEPTTLRDARWHSVIFIADRMAGHFSLYVDGALRAERTMIDDPRSSRGGEAKIGSNWDDSERLVGEVDEVRISEGVPPAGWVQATYEAGQDRLITYRPAQSR